MNKKIKIICIGLMVLMYLLIFSQNIYATTSIGDIFKKADDFVKQGQGTSTSGETLNDDTIKKMSNIIYNTLLILGIVLAVIIGMILGIKFMTGSISEQAKAKESLIAYVAGCIVVFGAFVMWKLVVMVLQSAPSA